MTSRANDPDLRSYFPTSQRPDDPLYWWRRVCWVTDRIAVSGDLPSHTVPAREHLRYWESEGITDVIDVRDELDDSEFIDLHSDIRSHWFGVDDDGGPRDPAWFTKVSTKAHEVLHDPARRLLVHCHMGVNRGPSAAYAILLTFGHHPVDALTDIRGARPIATIKYAGDAIRWHLSRAEGSHHDESKVISDVDTWLMRNRLDEMYLIDVIDGNTATQRWFD